MRQRISFEKLESALSCPWDKLKRNHKIFTGQTLFCYSMLSLFYWRFPFFNVEQPCTNVASCCWSVCNFPASIWSIIWCLFFLFSLVSFYYYSPQRDTCLLITPLGTCQKSVEEKACEKWHAGYLLISLLLRSMLSELPESILLSKFFVPQVSQSHGNAPALVHASFHITSLGWQMTLTHFEAKNPVKSRNNNLTGKVLKQEAAESLLHANLEHRLRGNVCRNT